MVNISRYCQYCGNEVGDSSDVCLKCGVLVSRKSVDLNSEPARPFSPISMGMLICFSFLIPIVSLFGGLVALINRSPSQAILLFGTFIFNCYLYLLILG